MKVLLFLSIVALAACSHGATIEVCNGNHWWSCKHYSSKEELAQYEKSVIARNVEAAKHLDVNVDDCAATLLIDQISLQQRSKDWRIFVSVIDADPSENLLAILGRSGIHAEPVSKLDPKNPDHETAWTFSVVSIRKRLFGGYEAMTWYHCGPLCAGTTEYQLKKDQNSCAISSRELLGVS